jgi:hypothetical protein
MQLIGVYKNGEGPSGLFTLPEAAWELTRDLLRVEGLSDVEPDR